MELNQENEHVDQKIDKINVVISKLLKEISVSRCESERFSMLSPIDSFAEDFSEYQDPCDSLLFQPQALPSEIIDKFQEILTENDRLSMRIEDLASQMTRSAESLIEIPITKLQLMTLNKDIEKLLKENVEDASIKVASNFFIIEPRNKPDKVIYFIEETNHEKSENKTQDFEDSKNTTIIDSDKDLKILKLQSELEIKYLEIAKKEENIHKLEEELGYKIQKLESLKDEYVGKIAELDLKISSKENSPNKILTPSNGVRKSLNQSSQGENPLAKNLFKALGKIDPNCEKREAKSFLSQDHDMSYSKTDSINLDKKPRISESILYFGNTSSKEKCIINYLKDQSAYYEQKLKEIQDYEMYLQETWIESFGNEKAVSVLQKASYKNFQVSMQLKKERELLDEKIMRMKKLQNITVAENTRLEFHRKKIWNERQALIKQQNDIEEAFTKIMSLR
ncbi:hypothetical protein SteCoe_24567 [Stentor coeruleus]|uniref:Uncharacterized protein n=1 Tax=Stentor coeruleus TaxID=5963 RepID=A0A1R2BHB8_9CILI|nr:hypothetical protein SteCoe_24567 [Stentor coeruleus]